LISNWDLRCQPILDFTRINVVRLPAFHQLDLRLDKKYFYKNWNFNWYIDVQNAYNFQAQQPPLLVPNRDAAGGLVVDPTDPTRYSLRSLENTAGTLLPTVGIIVEF
jgi:hypothetical protein